MSNRMNTYQRKIVFLCLIISAFSFTNAQIANSRYVLKVEIKDYRSDKGLKRIPVTVMPFNRKVETNHQGKLLLDMPQGDYTLDIDYYPYNKKSISIHLIADTSIVILLQSPFELQYIDEFEVLATKPYTENPLSVDKIDQIQFRKTPALMGEIDILKSFQLSSGVSASSEGAADLQVRGGTHGQNLYMLDGIPLYSTQHFFGMVSAYNPLIVKSAQLYKAGFPAAFGGKTSAVVVVKTKNAALNETSTEAEISLLTSKVAINTALIKNKVGFAISGRISNYSLINLLSLSPIKQDTKLRMGFGDINSNIFWKIDDKNSLKLFHFNNSDRINIFQPDRNSIAKSWINNSQFSTGVIWNTRLSEKSQNDIQLFSDKYVFDYGYMKSDTSVGLNYIKQIVTGIDSYGLSSKFKSEVNNQLNLEAGLEIKNYGFAPVMLNISDSTIKQKNYKKASQQFEAVVFAETELKIGKNQKLISGLRLNTFGKSKTYYHSAEPRFSYQAFITKSFTINTSISRMSQQIHRVANPGLGMPFEIFLSSDKKILPQKSWNLTGGIAKDFSAEKTKFSFKTDFWYKNFTNITEFIDGYDALMVLRYKSGIAENNLDIVTQGKGYACGFDFAASCNTKKASLTGAYTYTRAMNKFEALNNGNWFPASTEIRNSISITGELRLSPQWTFLAVWQYNSGRPITVPTHVFKYPINESSDINESPTYRYQLIETQRNNYRTKSFHKADVSFIRSYKAFGKYDSSLTVGIYNIYNRANPFFYFVAEQNNESGQTVPVLKSISMFPILPSFSWSMKF
ncbi:MAG: hypothetical protein EOM47_07615 [Bacteroidia bacterium]|nr:hypothetical protein [Bacteroidia bacterium]